MTKRLMLLSLVALASCELRPSEPVCSSTEGSITAAATFARPTAPLQSDLVVTGTADHKGKLAIREIVVNGVPATNTSFNFATWSVTVPVQRLANEADSTGAVTIKVRGVDACGVTSQVHESLPFPVDSTPEVRVDSLKVTVTIPGDKGFLPANGAIPALIQLSANPEAAGAVVTLSSSLGSFQGAPAGTVVLAGDGQKNPAVASLLFVSAKAGNALITASSKGQTVSATLVIADPPLLIPASASIAPGQQLTVTALSDGDVVSCQVAQATGITVTTSKVSATRTEIKLAAAATATAGSSVQVTCLDSFSQASQPGAYAVP